MQLSQTDLKKKYESLDTAELLELRNSGELTEMAILVCDEILSKRGLEPKEIGNQMEALTSAKGHFAWEEVTADLPPVWAGYVIAIVFFAWELFEIARNPDTSARASTPLLVIWFVGFTYWLFCVHRLHQVFAQATQGTYPITPGKGVGYHFIPFFNIYWVFHWPSELGKWLRIRRPKATSIRGWLGLPILAGILTGRVFDGALGLLILFLVMSYIARAVRQTSSVTAVFDGFEDRIG